MTHYRPDKTFFDFYAVDAEGHRIGLMTCRFCGATVIIDADNGADLHRRWHKRIEKAKP